MSLFHPEGRPNCSGQQVFFASFSHPCFPTWFWCPSESSEKPGVRFEVACAAQPPPPPSRRQPRPIRDACLRDSLLPCHHRLVARIRMPPRDRATLSPPQPLLACAMRCDPRRPAPDSVAPATLHAALRLYASAPIRLHTLLPRGRGPHAVAPQPLPPSVPLPLTRYPEYGEVACAAQPPPPPSRRQPRPIRDACLRDSLLPCHHRLVARIRMPPRDRATLSPPQPLLACAMRCDPRRPAPDSVAPATPPCDSMPLRLRLHTVLPRRRGPHCRATSTLPPSPLTSRMHRASALTMWLHVAHAPHI